MRYYKDVDEGYISAIGTGGGSGKVISEEEYNIIMGLIQNKPSRTETTDFRLKDYEFIWEEYEVPPEPPEDDIDDSESLNILLGRNGVGQ